MIPTDEQFSLKGMTNESGNYFINGIPYTGNGTQYKIIPRMGTHQFDPTHHTRFIGGNSMSHEANFKDKSSFPVSGYVYYSNTTVPVQGVMFKIDGTFANDGKGNLITTNDVGAFEISVPVGSHEVKAEKANHKFEGDGRITDSQGKDLNYQGPLKERKLYDKTTVRFIGRIGGGAIQEAHPLGHSLSTNNLGEDATIVMRVEKQGAFTTESITNKHFIPLDADKRLTDRWKGRETTASSKDKIITIVADKTTGEFVVDLIPEKFIVESAKTHGHNDILKNQITIDLSDKLVTQKELYEYKDSILVKGKYVYTEYSDTVMYHDSYKFIKRVDPTLDIVQLNRKGEAVAYLGSDSISFSNMLGEESTYAVYTKDDKYRLALPVFTMGTPYTFKATAYESYRYNGDGEESKVPTADGIVKIDNGLKRGPAGIDEVELNDKGEALYTFITGEPDLGAGKKVFGISVDFSGQSVAWNNGNNMEAYVLGAKSTGNDIVTEGPNRLITVLRDPPGSESYAYFEKGSVFTASSTESVSVNNDGSVATIASLGGDIVTSVGLGFTLETSIKNSLDIGIKAVYSTNNEWGNVTTSSLAISEQIVTSADPLYVGDVADIFVDNSTNISYGIAQTVSIVKTKDIVTEGANQDEPLVTLEDISLVKRNALSSTTNFSTMFAYPQIHIESVLIPNLIRLRDAMLFTKGTESAQEIANHNNMLRRVGADNTSFKYPTMQGSLKSARLESGDNLTYRNYNHENNMTVVAEVTGGINLRPNDRILAYLNGELRGRSIVSTGTQDELYFMNVISDEVGTVRFAVERDGEIIAKANNAINYGINHIEGSIDSPLGLNFEASVENVAVYPNPFKSVLKINVFLEKESNVEILIHSIDGSLIKAWKPSMLNAGQHEHLWNADAMSVGVYIVIVKIDNNTSTFKVIKK